MGRINGANSDYQYDGNNVVEVKPKPDQLYMKIYICPGEEKSPLETNINPCTGTKAGCPNHHNGHAMIHLNKDMGVEIVAGDNNRILVKQNGDIELGKEGGAARITLKADGIIQIDATTVQINGNLTVSGSYPGK